MTREPTIRIILKSCWVTFRVPTDIILPQRFYMVCSLKKGVCYKTFNVFITEIINTLTDFRCWFRWRAWQSILSHTIRYLLLTRCSSPLWCSNDSGVLCLCNRVDRTRWNCGSTWYRGWCRNTGFVDVGGALFVVVTEPAGFCIFLNPPVDRFDKSAVSSNKGIIVPYLFFVYHHQYFVKIHSIPRSTFPYYSDYPRWLSHPMLRLDYF